MTIQEYERYSNIAYDLFNYMNGKVNTMNNKCTFSIEPYDFVYHTYGNIKYPNHITLFIGNIIDENTDGLSKDIFIPTSIAWTICHELHHADQVITMQLYNEGGPYHQTKEAEVQQASYKWIENHSNELSILTGCKILIRTLTTDNLHDDVDPYSRVNAKIFYLQTISNSIFRNMDMIKSIDVFADDNKVKNIIAEFNNYDKVMIKKDWNYLEYNIPVFSSMVYHYAGRYDRYDVTLDIDLIDNDETAIARFTIRNASINGVIFRK